MKVLYLIFGLFLIIAINSGFVNTAASASSKIDSLRIESIALLDELSSKSGIRSSECEKIGKYLNKLFKTFEKKFLSSKSSVSIGDLKESYEKYSEKIRKCIAELNYCSPENQVNASNHIEKFLNDFMDAFGLNERVSQKDDMLIEALRRYPADSFAFSYADLWDTLNSLEAQNLPSQELLTFIDSAVLTFSERFVRAHRHEFAAESEDEVIRKCMINGISSSFNKSMDKLYHLQTTKESSRNSGDSGDEDEYEVSYHDDIDGNV